jgi:hypothetical protein
MRTLETRLSTLEPPDTVADAFAVFVTQLERTADEVEQAMDVLVEANASGFLELPRDWTALMSEASEQCVLLDQAHSDLLDTGLAAQLRLNDDLYSLAPGLEDLEEMLDRL